MLECGRPLCRQAQNRHDCLFLLELGDHGALAWQRARKHRKWQQIASTTKVCPWWRGLYLTVVGEDVVMVGWPPAAPPRNVGVCQCD